MSSVCGAGSGVAGRCGAGMGLNAAVSPPASSRFISSPFGCWPREGDIKKSSFILKNGLAPSCTELKAARLNSWQRRGEGETVPRRAGFGVHRAHPNLHPKGWGTARGRRLRDLALNPLPPSHWKGSLRAHGARDMAGTPAHGGERCTWWGRDREWGSHWHKYRDEGWRHTQAGD